MRVRSIGAVHSGQSDIGGGHGNAYRPGPREPVKLQSLRSPCRSWKQLQRQRKRGQLAGGDLQESGHPLQSDRAEFAVISAGYDRVSRQRADKEGNRMKPETEKIVIWVIVAAVILYLVKSSGILSSGSSPTFTSSSVSSIPLAPTNTTQEYDGSGDD
jgi:hypothetical protein